MSRGQQEAERVARKFFASLVLHDLISELPMGEVVAKYGLQKGPIGQMQDRASKTASMVSAFCGQLGWSDLEMLVAKFQGARTRCWMTRMSLWAAALGGMVCLQGLWADGLDGLCVECCA